MVGNFLRKRIFIGLAVYLVLAFVADTIATFVPVVQIGTAIKFEELFWFSFGWLIITAGFFAILLRKKIQIEWRMLYMYVAMMTMIGPIGELFINAVYRNLFGEGVSLWTYVIYPIHGGDTSLYSALFIWPYYGFYLYFLHQKLNINTEQKRYYIEPASFMAFDAIFLEFLVNISSAFFLGTLIFYYYPTDIAHLTTIIAAPFYFLGGIVVTRTIKRFMVDPVFFGTMSFLIAIVFVFLAG